MKLNEIEKISNLVCDKVIEARKEEIIKIRPDIINFLLTLKPTIYKSGRKIIVNSFSLNEKICFTQFSNQDYMESRISDFQNTIINDFLVANKSSQELVEALKNNASIEDIKKIGSKYSAQNRYTKANCINYNFKFNKKTDEEVIKKIERQNNKNGYIRKLIIEDLKK